MFIVKKLNRGVNTKKEIFFLVCEPDSIQIPPEIDIQKPLFFFLNDESTTKYDNNTHWNVYFKIDNSSENPLPSSVYWNIPTA